MEYLEQGVCKVLRLTEFQTLVKVFLVSQLHTNTWSFRCYL